MTRAGVLRRWHEASLRVRIIVATAAAAVVALLCAVTAFDHTLDGILVDSAVQSASDEAAHVVARLHDPQVTAQKVLAETPVHSLVIQVVDTHGTVVATTNGTSGGAALADVRPAPGATAEREVTGMPGHPDDPYVVYARGLDHPTEDGGTAVLVVAPLDGETQIVRHATVILAGLALVLLAALLLLIDLVLRRALGSVDAIRASVDSIRVTGEDARVPVPEGKDEIARLATTMNAMLDRLARSDAAQRAFVSDASHELRSPLTTIRMITEISPAGIDVENTRVIADESARMHQLVEDLLVLAKTDDRGLALEQRDVDLDDLVLAEARRVRAMSGLSVEQGLTVDVDVTAARTTGDPRRLAQVAHNLVDNAMRHARTGIRLRCAVDDGWAVLDIDNDGPPVAPEDRERIFDRFARLQEARDRDTGGSGLGLAIVRALVEAHGGTVVADVAPDGWCRFRVTLPAQMPEPVDESDWEDDDWGDWEDDTEGTEDAPAEQPAAAAGAQRADESTARSR